jgi:hypothetical protein
MKAALTTLAVLVVAGVLTTACTTHAGPAPPRQESAGNAAVNDTTVASRDAPTRAQKKPIVMDLPEITVTASRAERRFRFFPRFTTCRECLTCRIADVPDRRWQMEEMRVEEDGDAVILSAVIFTMQDGKVVLHWRRFVAANPAS